VTKLVIFDLDGVLIDSKDHHYEALNQALGEEYAISREEMSILMMVFLQLQS
tara:strand:- start:296 stop:451 length:156 start_codon:yes stop_codon:yes gene_type:complete